MSRKRASGGCDYYWAIDRLTGYLHNRFNGTDPEPRAGLSSGHIPSSLSLPFPTLVDTHTSKSTGKPYTTLKDQIALYRTFSSETTDSHGRSSSTQGGSPVLDFEKVRQASSAGTAAVTATCGSGMTAAVIWLAMRTLGIQTAIYDESWMVSERFRGGEQC